MKPKRWRLAVLALGTFASASIANAGSPLSASWPWFQADQQGPSLLPLRFRNHCYFDSTHGRYYCANHCGSDYQFYYCSKRSFGCCYIGFGYCGSDGALRCRP
jgi:hypothetical protein